MVARSADAAFAFGPDDQMMFHASYSGPFDIMNENTLTATLSCEYALSEESTVIANYVLQRVKPANLVANTSHAASLAIAFDPGNQCLVTDYAPPRRCRPSMVFRPFCVWRGHGLTLTNEQHRGTVLSGARVEFPLRRSRNDG